ncbi:MAG: ABC transporter permease [Pirellulaceae bacterium]|nr:ABC transporter permease [Pirellulaceae bacterium]
MKHYILHRVMGLIPTLIVILVVAFIVIYMVPGNPFQAERALSPEARAELEAKYGFDQPPYVQLCIYLVNLMQGDLGMSFMYNRSVVEIIAIGFPVTLILATVALAWALLLGVTAGIIGAVRQNTVWDYGAMTAAMLGISIPTFVLGPLLVLLFSLSLYWFPPAGWGSWKHILLPGITLGTIRASYIARLTRAGMLEVVRSDFVRTAQAKGLPEKLIIWRHMLRGGLLPVVSYLGPAIAFMMVGSVVVEKIFNTPGIGPYFVDAAVNRDRFLVMGIVLLESVFLLSMNLLVDLVIGWLDPRITYD